MTDLRMLSQEKAVELVRAHMMNPWQAARACRVLPHIILLAMGKEDYGNLDDIKYTLAQLQYCLCWKASEQHTKEDVIPSWR